jgi:glycosyltransferase involved in cell wall biosynthesis
MIPNRMYGLAGHHSVVDHMAAILSGNISPQTKKEIDEADVIVIERIALEPSHKFIKTMRDGGKQVWITFDDNYALIPATGSRDVWRGGKSARGGRGAILNEFREGLRLATGFMTPSELLCEYYSAYNERAEYVPNYLDIDVWRRDAEPDPKIITIGYGATSLHNISIKESNIVPALAKLCKQNSKVQIYLQPKLEDIIMLFNRLGVRYQTGNWLPVEQWPHVISQFNIGIAPLSGNYDMYRSFLKVLEYATLGIPWVATSGEPYFDARGGILVRNKGEEWYNALSRLIEDRSLYQKLSEEGLAWAQTHNANCVQRYEEIFNGK